MPARPRKEYHLGLIGYPLEHSFSPRLHHAALAAYGLGGEYQLFPVPVDEEGMKLFADILQRLRLGVLDGLNVTIPHKQLALQGADALSDVARAVGAVNTLYMDTQGRLMGENTDVPGFLMDLQRLTGPKVGTALVLGAGGSARAVVYALSRAGWRVRVLARRIDQAQTLAAAFNPAGEGESLRIEAAGFTAAALEAAGADCDLLVNTTPLGMYPNVASCPWPDDMPLPEQAAVYDLVYNPLETTLVRRARQAGLPASNGAGMLAAQAALAFQIWTGCEAPFEIMQKAFSTPQRT